MSLYQELLERKKDEDEPKSTESVIRKNGIKKMPIESSKIMTPVKGKKKLKKIRNERLI